MERIVAKRGVQPIVDFLTGKIRQVPMISKIDRCGMVYTKKVTLITGGNKGMGKGITRVFVDAGAKVVICGRDAEAGIGLAKELTEKGPGRCDFEKCDVSHPDQVRAVIDSTVRRFGHLDCLINNAGYHPPLGPVDDFTVEDLLELLQTNFISQFVSCQHALPHIRKTKGNIINMGSCTAVLGQEGGTIYAATKAAISAFTKSLAVEEAPGGVRVNAVLPGNIYTDSRVKGIQLMGQKGPEINRWAEANQPIGRSGTAEEVGQLCLFLATDAASYLTGVELMVTGGIELGVGVKFPPLFVDTPSTETE